MKLSPDRSPTVRIARRDVVPPAHQFDEDDLDDDFGKHVDSRLIRGTPPAETTHWQVGVVHDPLEVDEGTVHALLTLRRDER